MKKVQITRFAVAALTLVVIAGCGGATTAAPAAGGPLPPDSAAALEAIYLARTDSARTRFTEADIRFMTRMIDHHAQALEMARLVPDRTDNAQLRILAARIINAQDDEIATMQQWLRDRGQSVPGVDPDGTAHGPDHDMSMPGMVTPEQMRALETARGPDFDRLFLTLMIQHHAGAVDMVHELFATDGAGQDEDAFKIASDAQVDQATEIARMELLLDGL
ncbi:MAG: DUF305 domain-containing protein [Gemmatimonadota bacterium]